MRHFGLALALGLSLCVLGMHPSGAWAQPVGGVQQVLLEVKVMEVSRTKLRDLGFDWSSFGDPGVPLPAGGGPRTGVLDLPRVGERLGIPAIELPGFLEALQDQDLARVLSEPQLTTDSGEAATIRVGGPLPSIEFREFGTRLDLVPVILPNGNVRLEVRPTLQTLDLSVDPPSIEQRTTSTRVELPSGNTLAIAGLLPDDAAALPQKIPELGDVPVLGPLFRSPDFLANQSELLIFVTPTLVGDLGSGRSAAVAEETEEEEKADSETPQSPISFRISYFGAETKDSQRPDQAIVNTRLFSLIDNPHTGQIYVGEFGGPDTMIVYQEDDEEYDFTSGFSGSLSYRVNEKWAVEFTGFYVPEQKERTTIRSAGTDTFFSIPFRNTVSSQFDDEGFQHAILVGSNIESFGNFEESPGTVSIESERDDYWSAGLRIEKGRFENDWLEVDGVLGVRTLRLEEEFAIRYATENSGGFPVQNDLGDFLFAGTDDVVPQGSLIWARDRVRASNQFYGVDLGMKIRWRCGCPRLRFELAPSVSIGAMRQKVEVDGFGRARTPDGDLLHTPYGVFARPGGVGTESETRFAIVPELGVGLSYDVTERVQFRLDYHLVYISDVVFAGNQLDDRIRAPVDQQGGFTEMPWAVARPFERDDYWSQGISASVEFRF